MNLQALLSAVSAGKVQGTTNREIGRLRYDSRQVEANDVFFAWKGRNADGHRYMAEAVSRGAAAIVYESDEVRASVPGPTYVQVLSAREALSRMADLYYGQPSHAMSVVGITGTNGKTTTAFVFKHLLEKLGRKVGMLGTVRYEVGQRILPATRTTPEGLDLQELLALMREEKCGTVVMEVSSHALEQGRVDGVAYQAGVFTNLTPDHLDYHGTMDRYFAAKQSLFRRLALVDQPTTAVMNADDPYGRRILESLPESVRALSFSAGGLPEASLWSDQVWARVSGTSFRLHWEGKIHGTHIPLIGNYNVANVLGAIGALLGLGYDITELLPHLASIRGVPGRLERFVSADGVTAVVDYAHTADALEKVLSTLRALSPHRLIVVVGCGGNRDRTKRPLMANAACRWADQVIFTADNPRQEEVAQIFDDMRAGVAGAGNCLWREDRREAIAEAIRLAQPGDLLCVAGKGHETTQEVGNQFSPFDDREVVKEFLAGRNA